MLLIHKLTKALTAIYRYFEYPLFDSITWTITFKTFCIQALTNNNVFHMMKELCVNINSIKNPPFSIATVILSLEVETCSKQLFVSGAESIVPAQFIAMNDDHTLREEEEVEAGNKRDAADIRQKRAVRGQEDDPSGQSVSEPEKTSSMDEPFEMQVDEVKEKIQG